jgi:hypothetical protein
MTDPHREGERLSDAELADLRRYAGDRGWLNPGTILQRVMDSHDALRAQIDALADERRWLAAEHAQAADRTRDQSWVLGEITEWIGAFTHDIPYSEVRRMQAYLHSASARAKRRWDGQQRTSG